MADAAPSSAGGAERRFLTFRIDRRLYALPTEEVSEVIRLPRVARLPQSPASLLGLANLRGGVIPVVSARALLGKDEQPDGADSRGIVLGGSAPVVLTVDAVDALVSLHETAVETRRAELARDPGEQISGAFSSGDGGDVAKILDIRAMLSATVSAQVRRDPTSGLDAGAARREPARSAPVDQHLLVTFDVAGQDYSLYLDDVAEIVLAPDKLAAAPRAEAVLLGVMAYRDGLLPLLSLRGLLGFPAGGDRLGHAKVIVLPVGGVLVGLVADRMRDIVRADEHLIEPTPSMLAARSGGEARIKAIYRGDGGRRLVSILSPEQLFREDVMQRLGKASDGAVPGTAQVGASVSDMTQFLVFRLGAEEFGLPIAAVDEVARAPRVVTKVPKTPKFLEGVINLRGAVLPVVDQRRRFDMPKYEGEGRRLVVVRTERHRAGLIVDSVSEVLRWSASAIEPAPDLPGETARLVSGVINLEDKSRLVLVLDPAELLSRSERGLLDAFQRGTAAQEGQ